MRVAVARHGDRISPVLDVARQFVLLDLDPENGNETARSEVRIESMDLVGRTRRIVETGTHVLICGAISLHLETMLRSAGVNVIPNTCGPIDEIIAAFVEGRLTDRSFLMPGCTGQRRRFRRRGGCGRRGRKW
jgi:predicted Fe-Mo cluster-binding NifX family protein